MAKKSDPTTDTITTAAKPLEPPMPREGDEGDGELAANLSRPDGSEPPMPPSMREFVEQTELERAYDTPVRVRVKHGGRLTVTHGGRREAKAGEWVTIPARDLQVAAVRALVETEEDVANAGKLKGAAEAQRAESSRLFEEQRAAARQRANLARQAEQLAAEKAAAEKAASEAGSSSGGSPASESSDASKASGKSGAKQ